MHQVFYIDIDEEITSVISRLRKTKAKENIFVIPRRGLILQSVVNLKLLKSEADKNKKQLMIVTQDEQGRSIAEKLGILAQESLDGIEESEEYREDIKPRIITGEKNVFQSSGGASTQVEEIGSTNFFNSAEALAEDEDIVEVLPEKEKQVAKKRRKQASMSDIVKSKRLAATPGPEVVVRKNATRKVSRRTMKDMAENVVEKSEKAEAYRANMDPSREQELKSFFKDDETEPVREKRVVSGKSKKLLGIFMLVCFLLVVVVGAVLFYPKALVNVQSSSRTQSVDLDTKLDVNTNGTNLEEKIIPARIIEKEKSRVTSFPASGQGEISNAKAKGMVMIYNEYSSAPQPLVATTRLASADGKIFRLVKGVTVPGTSKVGGVVQPGVIEAEVVADQSGEEYNLNPMRFDIPGFKGSPKYDKFYAKSVKAMSGGGSQGDVVKRISAGDIEKAKTELRDTLKQELTAEMSQELQSGEKWLDDLLVEEVNIVEEPTAEKIADSFELELNLMIKVLIFSEKDLESIIAQNVNLSSGEKIAKIKIDYGQSTPDFVAGTANIKSYAQALIESVVDLDKLKNDLLGKRPDQLEEMLRSYPEVKGIEIEFYPDFLTKHIPSYGKRVQLELLPLDF